MDLATTLPAELWLYICDFLPRKDILKLSTVHPILRAYAHPHTWKILTLETAHGASNEQMTVLLGEPALRSYVTQIVIKATTPRRAGVWEQPFLHLRHALLSYQSTSAILEVVPNLENNHIVTKLRCLHLELGSRETLEIFSSSLRDSAVVFEHINALILHLYVGQGTEFMENVRTIADACRTSIQALRLIFGSFNTQSNSVAAVLSSLGAFPHLGHFDFTTDTDSGARVYQEFVMKHRSTLMCLQTTTRNPCLLPLSLYSADPSVDPPRNIKALNFAHEVPGTPYWWMWSGLSGLENLARYAGALTTLILEIIPGSTGIRRGLDFQEVTEIVTQLDQKPHGVLLERLKLTVSHLRPQLIDLMASYLGKLHILDLTYMILVNKAGQNTNEVGRSFVSSYLHSPEVNCPQDWKLQSVDLNSGRGRQNMDLMRLAASRIPSIRAYGPFDWSDADFLSILLLIR
ncbi:hypothetical protein BDN72DRAFT_903656 [Pluteus cervinus]|uniref:Uncharacterized protein n=1 Tax=Pluteus cervinus TaxID=181527 RepID=A0ACD3A8C4_9AGAR|nr:hypothetical protein BDN72DRAFT_903656 [Pluteus cervinus]